MPRLRRSLSFCLLTATYIVITYFLLYENSSYSDQILNWSERRQAVQDYCSLHPVNLQKPKHLRDNNRPGRVLEHYRKKYEDSLVVNIVHIPRLNLNWCLVPKVVSTSISAAILPHLRPGGEEKVFPYLQKEVWARAGHIKYQEFREHQNTSPSFLITRHPFTRLASAFINKLEDRSKSHDGEYFYNTYSKHIIKYSRGHWEPGEAEPTFSEFVHYLINTDPDQYDEHWQPISIRCRVCQLYYSHILHYEQFETEWAQFLKEVRIEKELELSWENKGRSQSSLQSYYHLITPEEKLKLYQKYLADFHMFGYDIDDELL